MITLSHLQAAGVVVLFLLLSVAVVILSGWVSHQRQRLKELHATLTTCARVFRLQTEQRMKESAAAIAAIEQLRGERIEAEPQATEETKA